MFIHFRFHLKEPQCNQNLICNYSTAPPPLIIVPKYDEIPEENVISDNWNREFEWEQGLVYHGDKVVVEPEDTVMNIKLRQLLLNQNKLNPHRIIIGVPPPH